MPVIDIHPHVIAKDATRYPLAPLGGHQSDWSRTRPVTVEAMIGAMDEAGVEKVIVLTEATGAEFDRLAELYRKNYPNRFQLWCGLDEQEIEKPDYPERAAAELDRCYRNGGRGVGELSDKGWGIKIGRAHV